MSTHSTVFGQTLLSQQFTFSDTAGIPSAVSGTSGEASTAAGAAPASTLVGSPHGLQFDLIWDPSVNDAPSGFRTAVIQTAQLYSSLYSSKEVVALDIGWGEVGGYALPSSALGASLTNGYLTDYPTVASSLGAQGFTFNASNEPTNAAFFVASAEAKAWGLVDPYDTSTPDGYIGFGTLAGTPYSWNTHSTPTLAGSGTGPNQFDLQSVVQHEMSEVMGRIGIEGPDVFGIGLPTYTPLDLFNFSSPGVLELSGDGGYFSVDNGVHNLGRFNDANASHGGDVADWASYSSVADSGTIGLVPGDQDSYNAFGRQGINGALSVSDLGPVLN